MYKLHLYEDCGSVKKFAEKYLNDNFEDFVNARRRFIVKEGDSAKIVKNKEDIHAFHVFDELSGYLRIAIADYLEDHEPVEWPKEQYKYVPKSGDPRKDFHLIKLFGDLYPGMPQTPKLEIEKRYDKLQFEYDKLTQGDKPSSNIVVLLWGLYAIATIAAIVYFVTTRTPLTILHACLLLPGVFIAVPLTFFMIKAEIENKEGLARYRAKKKAMEQEMKEIRDSEEYQAALIRRRDMPERIARWQKQMKEALEQDA